MRKKGFLVFGRVASATLLSILLTTPGAQAAPPLDDTDAERYDHFGSAVARGDFNGDGYADLAIGVPAESIGSDPDAVEAGAVEVIYGSSIGLDRGQSQFLRQGDQNVEDKPGAGDHFGAALAAGDFDRDGYADLAIGAPDEDAGGDKDSGAVNVIYGSASGLSANARADQLWHQDIADIEDWAEGGDLFGSSLVAGDFNDDGWDDLAIGVPGEDVGIIVDDGAVHVIYGSASGLSALYVSNHTMTQCDIHEAGDQFGWSLAAGDFNGDGFDDLAVGVPMEGIWYDVYENEIPEYGAVNVFYGSIHSLAFPTAAQFWNQEVPGVEGTGTGGFHKTFGWSVAAGDFNGDRFDDLAIGVPHDFGAQIENGIGEGAVNVIYGTSIGLDVSTIPDDYWHQDLADLPDDAKGFEGIGKSLTVGDFNRDRFDDLAIGVPDADVPPHDAGAVNLMYGSVNGLDARTIPSQIWHQDVADVEDAAGSSDAFGSALAAGDFNGDGHDDLAIGVPLESLESAGGSIYAAGAVNVIYGSFFGLDATKVPDQFWTQVFISPPLP